MKLNELSKLAFNFELFKLRSFSLKFLLFFIFLLIFKIIGSDFYFIV